jgi:hypothetical protein
VEQDTIPFTKSSEKQHTPQAFWAVRDAGHGTAMLPGMTITSKHLTATPIAALAAASVIALSGCGDSTETPPASVQSGQIATVGTDGAGVTKAQFDRFLKAQLSGTSPLGGSITGAIPLDPPAFTKCKAAIAANSAKQKGPKPTGAQLKSACESSYKQARAAVEGQLINYQWMLAEGKAKGIETKSADVNQTLQQFVNASGSVNGKQPSASAAKAKFDAKLKASGLTLDDVKLQVQSQIIQQKLAAKNAGDAKGKDLVRKQIEFLNGLQKKWRAGTLCLKGYIVAQCSNGPKLADLQPPK